MARTQLAIQTPKALGAVPSYAAVDAVNGMAFFNTGSAILHVKNGGGASINVTLTTGGAIDGLVLPNQIVAIPAASEKMISLANVATYQQADGTTYVDFSSATSVTVALFQGGVR